MKKANTSSVIPPPTGNRISDRTSHAASSRKNRPCSKLISNVSLIYSLLIGITDLLKANLGDHDAQLPQDTYYEDIDLNDDSLIEHKLQERTVRIVKEKKFHE